MSFLEKIRFQKVACLEFVSDILEHKFESSRRVASDRVLQSPGLKNILAVSSEVSNFILKRVVRCDVLSDCQGPER